MEEFDYSNTHKEASKTPKDSSAPLGVSPLVAAVLLIAVTMTIAGMLAYWATSFVKTSLPETNLTESECRFAAFSIYACTYSNSTKSINFILENLKNIELKSLKVFLIYPNSTVSSPFALNDTLPVGMLKSYQLQNIAEDFSKLMVTTNCPDISKEKICARA